MPVETLDLPLTFGHVYSSAPWGGRWIKTLFARTDAPEVCSESWELSAHPFGMSVVKEGPLAGRTLAELAGECGSALVGTHASDPHRFPVLAKLLDARRSLSVQVHPNERNASATGGEPKTEAWLVLAAAPGAALYAGLQPGVSEADFRSAVQQGEAVVGMMIRHGVKAGDVLYVPGGMVHAIGAGCLVFEVQQTSNTTYRLYDWDRTDAYGRMRPLHVEQALKSIDFSLPPIRLHRAREEAAEGANAWSSCVRSPKFTVRRLMLADTVSLPTDGSTFHAFFVEDGAMKVACGAGSCHVMRGGTALVAASATSCTLSADIAGTRVLVLSV